MAKMVFLKAAFPRQAKKWRTRYNDYGMKHAQEITTVVLSDHGVHAMEIRHDLHQHIRHDLHQHIS